MKAKFELLNRKLAGQELLVGVIVIAWVAVGYTYFVLNPMFKQFAVLGPEIVRLKNSIKSTKMEEQNLLVFREKAAELKIKMTEYQKRLPAEEEIPALLESLSRLATDCRVRIQEISPLMSPAVADAAKAAEAKAKESFREIPFLIKTNAGYHELGLFINRLEEGERLVEVTDLKIQGDPENPRLHSAELKISIFVLKKGESSSEN